VAGPFIFYSAAVNEGYESYALSFRYGQRHKVEIKSPNAQTDRSTVTRQLHYTEPLGGVE